MANGAEKNGVGGKADFEGRVGEWVAVAFDGNGAHVGSGVTELVAEAAGNYIQYFGGLLGHFRADAVAGQEGDVFVH